MCETQALPVQYKGPYVWFSWQRAIHSLIFFVPVQAAQTHRVCTLNRVTCTYSSRHAEMLRFVQVQSLHRAQRRAGLLVSVWVAIGQCQKNGKWTGILRSVDTFIVL